LRLWRGGFGRFIEWGLVGFKGSNDGVVVFEGLWMKLRIRDFFFGLSTFIRLQNGAWAVMVCLCVQFNILSTESLAPWELVGHSHYAKCRQRSHAAWVSASCAPCCQPWSHSFSFVMFFVFLQRIVKIGITFTNTSDIFFCFIIAAVASKVLYRVVFTTLRVDSAGGA